MSVMYDVCLDGLTACEKPNTALMNLVMEAQLYVLQLLHPQFISQRPTWRFPLFATLSLPHVLMPFKWPIVWLVCVCVCVYTQGVSTNKLGVVVVVEGSGEVDGWAGPLGPEGTLDPRHRHHWPFSSSPASPLPLGLPTSTATSSFLLRAATMSGRVLLQSAVILWLVHVAHTGGEWKAELEAPPMENNVINSVVWIVWWVWWRPVLFKMQDVTWLRKQRMQPF